MDDCFIGAYSYVSPGTSIHNTNVGRYCSIGFGVTVGPTRHPVDWLTTSPLAHTEVFFDRRMGPLPVPFDIRTPIKIGNDVWIGTRAAIMGGVMIGNGAIIGYGAVVTKDVPPYAIVGGAPARVLRMRFDEAAINKLTEFQWWRLDLFEARRAKDSHIVG